MKPSIYRRIRRRTASHEAVNSKKENKQESSFFGEAASEHFFQPAAVITQAPVINRKCAACEQEDKKVQRAADKKEEDKTLQRMTDKKEEEKLQRQPEKKEEEKLMKKCDEKEEEKIQKKEAGNHTSAPVTSSYISSLNSKGTPLPKQSQQFFGSRMGYDFSNVKVHTDQEAAQSAKEVNAKAYTTGEHIVFNEGQYDTNSAEGKKLMAHELAHVVQNDQVNWNLNRGIQRDYDYLDAGVPASDPYAVHTNCLVRNGLSYGGIRIAGVISEEETKQVNNRCREESSYTGEDYVASADESRQVLHREFLSMEQGDRLEKAYSEALTNLYETRSEVTPHAMQSLMAAYGLLKKGDWDVPEPIFVSHQINGVIDNKLHVSHESVKAYGIPALAIVATGAGAGGYSSTIFGGVFAGTSGATSTAAAATTIVEVPATAATGVAGSIAIAVIIAALAGYGLYKLFEWAAEIQEVDPAIGSKVDLLIESLAEVAKAKPITPYIPMPDESLEPELEKGPDKTIDIIPAPDTEPDKRNSPCVPPQFFMPWAPTGLLKSDPIDITWFKPLWKYENPIRIKGKDYYMNIPGQSLPYPLQDTKIGVDENYLPAIGKLMMLFHEQDRSAQAKFKRRLRAAGYSWVTENGEPVSPDHVLDLMWNGPDVYENLWPLESNYNSVAGLVQNMLQSILFRPNKDSPCALYLSIELARIFYQMDNRHYKIRNIDVI